MYPMKTKVKTRPETPDPGKSLATYGPLLTGLSETLQSLTKSLPDQTVTYTMAQPSQVSSLMHGSYQPKFQSAEPPLETTFKNQAGTGRQNTKSTAAKATDKMYPTKTKVETRPETRQRNPRLMESAKSSKTYGPLLTGLSETFQSFFEETAADEMSLQRIRIKKETLQRRPDDRWSADPSQLGEVQSFIDEFDKHELRMREIKEELQENAEKVRKMNKSTIVQSVCGGLTIGAAGIMFFFNPLGASLLATAGIGVVTGAAVERQKEKEKLVEEEKELRKEFSEWAHLLKIKLEKEVDTEIEEALKAVRPKIKAIINPGKDSDSADCIQQRADLCQEVTDEFEKIKEHLDRSRRGAPSMGHDALQAPHSFLSGHI